MSMPMGAVLVLPPGHSLQEVGAVLANVPGGASEASPGAWRLGGIADGWLRFATSKIGFDLLLLRFSHVEYLQAPEETIEWLERWREAVAGLGPRFGFLTADTKHLDPSWLDDEVLIPLLAGNVRRVLDGPYEGILAMPAPGPPDPVG